MNIKNQSVSVITNTYVDERNHRTTEITRMISNAGFETLSREIAGRKSWNACVSELYEQGYKQSQSNEKLFTNGSLRASVYWMRDSREVKQTSKKDSAGNIKKTISLVSFYTGEAAISRWVEPAQKPWLKRG